MIIAGIIIGPHGFNLLARNSSIILSGTAGLLYIMFLSGLEIDLNDFKKNVGKSTVLGLYGFIIPMLLGILTGIYVLHFSATTSVLLASMFASHTLLTYPIVSKLGISRDKAVNISVGSTMITNILALLVLAIIVGMYKGEMNHLFWVKLILSFITFTVVVLFVFPIISRWFFKKYSDNVLQYIFVLVIMYLSAVLSRLAGIEPIIGAFLAGLALNRLIPSTSPLMNRIDFVGNAIFIPFFLIGVGMLIDFRAFSSLQTILVAIIMSILALAGKFIAAWMTQKTFRFSLNERTLIFGLTGSQAAATLAAVLVGYNIIIGSDSNGQPIRLFNDNILNGTVVMILVTCTVAAFATQKSAQKIILGRKQEEETAVENIEKILIPVSNPGNIPELVHLSTIIKAKNNSHDLYALNIINTETSDSEAEKKARNLLYKAKMSASAVDIPLKILLRYDINIVNGITNIIKENSITDLVLGLHAEKKISDSFLGILTEGILAKNNLTTYIYRPFQPISTIRRHVIIIPQNAEFEIGFSYWLSKIWNIASNTGSRIVFYGSGTTLKLIGEISAKHPINNEMHEFANWDDLLILAREIKEDDNIIFIMSREKLLSFNPAMNRIPGYLTKYFQKNNFLLIYPSQSITSRDEKVDLINPSLLEAVEKIETIGKTIAAIFRKPSQ
jgi:Kef-type K+ transport system membrane component KefB